MRQDSETLDIAQALRVVRRRALLIAFCVAVVAAAAFGYSKLQTKEYTATASLIFRNSPLSQQIAGLSPGDASSQLAAQTSNVELVGLGDMAAQTARRLRLPEELVRNSVEVKGQGESNLVSVSATSKSPELAARIATVYAHQFVREQQRARRGFYRSALALVKRQLDELPADQRFGPVAVPLQNRAQALELLEGLKSDDVQMAQNAIPPSEPSTPKTVQNTMLGALLGLLLGIGLAFVLERLERARRLRDPEDLEATYGLPLLGAIPASRALAQGAQPAGRPVLSAEEAEAFQLVRARLRFSAASRERRTVMVCGAERGAGTSTVARCLAEAAVRTGARVLLVEADLRNPVLAFRFGLRPGAGLPEVLSGGASMDVAIQSVDVGAPSGKRNGARKSLDVLACSLVPPANPGELIESHETGIVLDRARSTYDLVLIDAPPPSALAEAFTLLGMVDGVVVVSWAGRSLRAGAERLSRTLHASGVPQLGVVANGVRASTLDSFAAGSAEVAASGVTAGPVSVHAGQQPEAPVTTAEA